MFDNETARTDQMAAALRDIADISFLYYHQLQTAGFTEPQAWEVMCRWNDRFVLMLQPSS